MEVLSDSSAILELNRILPQHQSAITLLNSILQNPDIQQLNWLDIACGKGQIISQLKENLTDDNRRKIRYLGYDINVNYTRIASRFAYNMGFNNYQFIHGDIGNLANVLERNIKFDFITCTNVVHELHIYSFLDLVLESLTKLSNTGQLFIYDMESMQSPELGALPLKGIEVQELLNTIFEYLETRYRISPNIWSHTKCKGWTIVINWQHLHLDQTELERKKTEILHHIEPRINCIIERRSLECCNLLDSYTEFGIETAADEQVKQASLYEFWALYRAKEKKHG